jgi:vancomycin resistance protein VanW
MKPLSSRNRFLYGLSVALRRGFRHLELAFGGPYATERSPALLPYPVISHGSLLLRRLQGSDMKLQRNKVKSLEIACSRINGVLVRPGETFSFWKLVGRPSASRGFPPGLQLSFGRLVSMEGGGLCQLSNLIHWMVLHSPLTVVERHRHSTDPFPDHRRTVPFGTGATVFYNYLDFAFRNDSSSVYQVTAEVGPEHLRGELRCDTRPVLRYSVEERDHRFVREGDAVYRENTLWNRVTDASSGEAVGESLLMENRCRVLYDVKEEDLG